MKLFCMLFLTTIGGLCFSQSKSSLIGKWKTISMQDHEIYFNLKTDSFSISNEIKSMYPDPDKQKQFLAGHKAIFGSMQYHFGANDTLTHMFNDTLQIGQCRYTVAATLDTITCIETGDDGVVKTDKILYKISDGLLYLKYDWEERLMELVLERLK